MIKELEIKNSMKIKNLKLKISITLLFAICYLLSAGFVHAQNVDLGIYPPVFQIQANPPTDVKIPFSIQNLKP